jgi:CBS domain-containing protein
MATATEAKLVRDIMTPEPATAEEGTTIRQLARLFEENEISGAPVVGPDGRLVGVVSKSDLIRRCSEGTREVPPGYLFELLSDEAGEDTELVPEPLVVVGDFMTEEPITARPDEPLSKAAHRMAAERVHRLIVVDEDMVPIGIVTTLDILGAFPQGD